MKSWKIAAIAGLIAGFVQGILYAIIDTSSALTPNDKNIKNLFMLVPMEVFS